MWSFLERAKRVVFYLVLSIIPLVLIYVQSKDERVKTVLSWPVIETAGWIEQGAVFIVGGISDVMFRYFYLVGRTNELLALRAEVLKTKALSTQVLNLLNEGQAIRELCFQSMGQDNEGTRIVARVIARAGEPRARMIRINKGKKHGIQLKSSVISGYGAVGQILTVASHFSDVLLISDASSALDAKIIESNVRGLLRGGTSNSKYVMEIQNIDGQAKVNIGDRVVTSGLNSHFPAGIPIGIISKAFHSPDGLTLTARIEPLVEIDKLSHVIVLGQGNEEMSLVDPQMAAWPMVFQ